ncbi:MAG: dihydroorotase [Polyangiaceae bacterium]|nr:dihydroorotase [Polyangiaceae bacterium]
MTDALVFRDVRAIDPAVGRDERCDVVVERGLLTRIGPGASQGFTPNDRVRVVDGGGCWLLPALVDQHVHLREPGYEYKEDIASGLAAAAAGGYAHVCAMPNTNPVNDTRAVTELMLARGAECTGARLHPIVAITRGLEGKQLTELAELKAAGAVGASDDGRCVTSSTMMLRALEYARNFNLPIIQHAEDHELTQGALMHEGEISARLGLRGWPRVAEDAIIARDVLFAEYVGARYHAAHISTAGAVRILREAKARGISVTCEVTPHHLLLTDQAVLGYDTACKVNPPLREAEDMAALRSALADGTIDVIATDHAPQSSLEKDCEFAEAAPGLVGLELCLPLMLGLVREGTLSLGRLLDAMSTQPARIMGISAPTLQERALAELTLVDPELAWTPATTRLATKSRNTPFLDRTLVGRAVMTLVGGTVVHDLAGGRA